MSIINRSKLTRFENIQVHCLANPYPNPGFQAAVTELDGHMDAAHAQWNARLATAKDARAATLTKKAAKAALREAHLAPIAAIAAGQAADDPVLAARLRLPKEKLAARDLIRAATVIADEVTPVADRFITDGLADDFVARLRAAIAEYTAAVERAHAIRAARRGSRDALVAALEKLDDVARRLNGINTVRYTANPQALGSWRSVYAPPAPTRNTGRAAAKAKARGTTGSA